MNDPDAGTAGGTASFLAARSGGKRADLAVGPHAVYQAVLRVFASTGRPPEPTELQETARRYGITASRALAGLSATDVLGLDGQGRSRMAYPYADVRSAAQRRHLTAATASSAVWPAHA